MDRRPVVVSPSAYWLEHIRFKSQPKPLFLQPAIISRFLLAVVFKF